MKLANRLTSLRMLPALAALSTLLLAGCATRPSNDYGAFREARPASILVLPPVNESPDVRASNSVYSYATAPLAEAGYYVFPVTLVDEAFRQNGVNSAADAHDVALPKLREIFGADAVLYIRVTQYGTKYMIIASETRVTAEGTLVDARTGTKLWNGTATASSGDNSNSGGGVVGLLVKALVNQIVDTVSDRGHQIAGLATANLLSPARPNGILYGPRAPMYKKEGAPAP